MKWIKNLENLSKNGNVGMCPFCGSSDTDASFSVMDKKSNMGYGVIWCNKCKHAFKISRIEIINEMKEKEVPRNLIF